MRIGLFGKFCGGKRGGGWAGGGDGGRGGGVERGTPISPGPGMLFWGGGGEDLSAQRAGFLWEGFYEPRVWVRDLG